MLAVGVLAHDVAGPKPPAGKEELRVGLGAVVVTAHHAGAAQAQLARYVGRDLRATVQPPVE